MERYEQLAALLPQDVDAVLITGEWNRRYFTGLSSTAGTLLITREKAYFIIDFRYIEAARRGVKGCEVLLQQNLAEQLREILHRHKLRRIAVETSYMTVGERQSFQRMLPEAELLEDDAVDSAILTLRSIKSPEEIEKIRKAQSITDAAFSEILDYIAPGRTEREVAAYLEYAMKRRGADGLAFDTIAVAGPNSALPHGIPGDRPLQNGDFLTLDFGARYDGYCSDMTRTVAIGEPTDEMREVYDTVYNAQLAALSAAVQGISCRSVDAAARDYIYARGYEGCFGHGTGHAVGLEIHEKPVFSPSAAAGAVCQNGMVLTVEPGIYLEGKFGCRIEDMIAFTENGVINLTNSLKELIIL